MGLVYEAQGMRQLALEHYLQTLLLFQPRRERTLAYFLRNIACLLRQGLRLQARQEAFVEWLARLRSAAGSTLLRQLACCILMQMGL